MEEKHIARRGEVDACLVCSFKAVIVHVSLSFFFLRKKTMVPNGIDRMWMPSSAVDVNVVRNSRQARVNGESDHDPLVCGVLCLLSSCSLVSLMSYMYMYFYLYMYIFL